MTTDRQSSYSYEDLILSGKGELFGAGNPQLPKPPMLMFDRITNVSCEGGTYGKGIIEAELDIKPDLWFFECHFQNDPVMPGCLGLDALWQLLGFYLGWIGGPGAGRARAAGEVKFTGQVLPDVKLIKYTVNLKRVKKGKLVLGIGDGIVNADGEDIYQAKGLKVVLFDNSNRK